MLNIGIIGCGKIAQVRHLPEYEQNPGARIAGLYDLNRERAQALAAQYGISWLPSDFKKKGGYQRSIVLSREYDLYRQNFCGCVYSRLEAERRMAQE